MIIRVLLADDHPATCAGLRAMLDTVPDIEVVGEAHDGLEVQRLIAELHPDVLLLDLVMPDLRPVEFVRWSRANYPGTEVLSLTAHDRDYYLAWMVEVGAAGFVTKDEVAENLVAAIRHTVRGEVLFSREQLARAGRWREAAGQKWERLTKREQEVLRLVAQGLDKMRSHIKHRRIPAVAALTFAALLGCLLSSGCRPHLTTPTEQASPSVEAGLWATTSPTLQLSATPSPTPQPMPLPTLEPTPRPTPDAQALQAYGSLLYLDGRSVWEGWGLMSDRLVAELPFREIVTAQLVDNRLWVLADGRLAVVDLASGAVEVLAELEPSTRRTEGRLLVLPDSRVVYSVLVDEWGGGAGYATTVWLYDPQAGQARMLTKRDAGLAVLAPTLKGDALYAAPIGGDGALTAIVTIDLEDGAIASTVEFQRVGMGGLALSPDGRKVAVSDAQNWSQADVQGCITIYDLAEPEAAPVTIVLPKQPSYTFSLTWAPNGRYLYFALEANPSVANASGQPLEQAYGLWQADAHSGELREIAPSHSDQFPRPVMISPDGRDLLVSGIPYDLVDVQTGERFSTALPPLAPILDWRTSDAQ